MTFVGRLSVVTAYLAMAFVGEVVGLLDGDAACGVAAHHLADRLDGLGLGRHAQFEPVLGHRVAISSRLVCRERAPIYLTAESAEDAEGKEQDGPAARFHLLNHSPVIPPSCTYLSVNWKAGPD